MPARPRIAIPVPTSFDSGYNRRCWPEYSDAVERCGGEAVEVPLGASQAEVADIMTGCHGVLLPGSPADVNPQKYGQNREVTTAEADVARENVDELLLQDAHNLSKPILGVCYGLQILNTWRGGTLIQDLSPRPVDHSAGANVSVAHAISLLPGTVLSSLLQINGGVNAYPAEALVNSSHHQAIGIPGDNLHVAARCPEDGVIEALEGGASSGHKPAHFVVGVQWHPERTFDQDLRSKALFGRFIAAGMAWSPRAILTSVVSEQ